MKPIENLPYVFLTCDIANHYQLFRDSMSIINAKERSILEAMGISN